MSFLIQVSCDSCQKARGPVMGSLAGAESAAKKLGWEDHMCPACVSKRNKNQMRLFK